MAGRGWGSGGKLIFPIYLSDCVHVENENNRLVIKFYV